MNTQNLSRNGITIPYDSDVMSDNILNHIKAGTYEQQESQLIKGIIQEGERILEIGCGVGYLSSVAMKTGKVRELLCFEANPKLIPVINKTFALNNVQARCRNGVITNTSSGQKVNFYVRQDFWASSLSPEPYGYKEMVEVEAVNFQELLNEYKPTMIICDIEGGESELFEGVQLFGVTKVFMEIHQNEMGRGKMKSLFERFCHLGFHYDVWHSNGQVVLFSHVSR